MTLTRSMSTRFLAAIVAGAGLMAPLPAAAESYEKVDDKAAFLAAVQGRKLRLALYGITLSVNADGSIKGKAFGKDVTGSWDWNNGLFCRELELPGSSIARNCQLVEVVAGQSIRFTADAGQGREATFQIQ